MPLLQKLDDIWNMSFADELLHGMLERVVDGHDAQEKAELLRIESVLENNSMISVSITPYGARNVELKHKTNIRVIIRRLVVKNLSNRPQLKK